MASDSLFSVLAVGGGLLLHTESGAVVVSVVARAVVCESLSSGSGGLWRLIAAHGIGVDGGISGGAVAASVTVAVAASVAAGSQRCQRRWRLLADGTIGEGIIER